MRDFFRSAKFKILVALMAVVIGVMVYSLTKGGYAADSASFFSIVLEPFQKMSTSISESVTGNIDTLVNAKKYHTENDMLKKRLNELYIEIADYDRITRENAELRELLGLKEENRTFEFSAPCTVIARTTNDPYGSFTIDRGSKDGIEPYDPVITAEGLVGVCYEVSRGTSRVQTLYSPRTAVGVTAIHSKATGIIEGDYELASSGCCRMSYISKSSDIKAGDIIFTTGSETFPEGQLIGTVEAVGMEDSGLSKYAIIRPAIDPETVNTVFVITDFRERGDE